MGQYCKLSKVLILNIFFLISNSSFGQNKLENFEIKPNGVAHFTISTFGENVGYSIMKKINNSYVTIAETRFLVAHLDPLKPELRIIKDSLVLPLDSGENKFVFISIWDKQKIEREVYSSKKNNHINLDKSGIQHYPNEVVYSIRDTTGNLIKSDRGKFINYKILPKGTYYLQMNSNVFTFNR